MKKSIIFLLAILYAGIVWGQTTPNWLQFDERERNYPSSVYITGYAPGNTRAGESKVVAEERLRKDAMAYVTESVLVQVNSEKRKREERIKTQATGKEENEQIQSVFESNVNTSSNLDLAGVKTETYIDDSKGIIHAFAYVKKDELIGYYNASFTITLQQLESAINTAKQLETAGEKAKARKQYEDAIPLLVKAEQAQDVLSALGSPISTSQSEKTAKYRSEIVLALAKLAQGVYIYVESKEDLFGKSTSLIANKVKGILSKNGCSFTDTAAKADFILKLNASARERSDNNGIFFCDADVEIKLIKRQTQQAVCEDEIKQKGGDTSYEKAARKAFEDVANVIADKLMEWVKN